MTNLTVTGKCLSDLTKKHLYLNNIIDRDTIASVVKSINEINLEDDQNEDIAKFNGQKYKRSPIVLHLDSPGGSVYSGLSLVGTMLSSKTPVHVIASGTIASMAFTITCAAHYSVAKPYTTFMYHSVSTVSAGMLQDIIEDIEEAKRIQKICDKIITSNTAIDKKQLKKCKKAKKDWYMDTNKAITLGIINKVL